MANFDTSRSASRSFTGTLRLPENPMAPTPTENTGIETSFAPTAGALFDAPALTLDSSLQLKGFAEGSAVLNVGLNPIQQLFPDVLPQSPLPQLGATQEPGVYRLAEALEPISPQFAEALRKGHSLQNPALLQEGLNFTLANLLNSHASEEKQKVQQLLEKAMGGEALNPEEKELLANYQLSVRDGQVFDEHKQRPVEDFKEVLDIPDRLAERQFSGLSQALFRFREGFELTPNEHNLLGGLGLMVKDGQMINLLTRQPVPPQDLRILESFAFQIRQDTDHLGLFPTAQRRLELSLTQGPVAGGPSVRTTFNADRFSTGVKLQMVGDSTRELLAQNGQLNSQVRANRAQLESKGEQLSQQDASNAVLRTELEQVQSEKPRLEAWGRELEQAQNWFISLPPGQDPATAFQALPAEQRQALAPALKRLGFEVRGERLISTEKGEPVTSEAIQSRLAEEMQAYTAELQKTEARINQLMQQLAEGMLRSRTLRQEISSLGQAQDQLGDALQDNLKGLQGNREALLAIRRDPAQWNALSPEEQTQVETWLGEVDQAVQTSQENWRQARTTREKVDQIAEHSLQEETRNQAALDVAQMFKQFLSNQERLFERLEKQLSNLGPSSRSLENEVRRLVTEANDLAARVELTPRPFHIGIENLAEEWEHILTEARRLFDAQFQAQLDNENVANQLQVTHARRLKDGLEYHTQQLAESRQFTGEQLKRRLEAQLADFGQAIQ
ncbi:MAG: hypothetical protein ACO1RX_11630 [Candidatus Sericytochromatia bacterium]